MKQTRLLFLFIGFLLFACSKEEEALIDLSGEWTGKGDECEGRSHDETVNIVHDLSTGRVVATKVTGDNCVTAGNITFTGEYDGIKSTFTIVGITGTPDDPDSGRQSATMRVMSANSMTIVEPDIQFTRN